MKVETLLFVLWFNLLTRAPVAPQMLGTDGSRPNLKTCGQGCKNSNCTVGMTCQLEDDGKEKCYKCHNCVNHRKYYKQFDSNERSHQTKVECVEIDISWQCPECLECPTCHECPECPTAAPITCPTIYKSNGADGLTGAKNEPTGNSEVNTTYHVFFAWTLFAISLLTNLILSAVMLHQQCRRSNNIITLAEIVPLNDY